MNDKRIILLEFNELCPPLMMSWLRDGLLPNFKRFFDAAAVFETVADEPVGPNLNPWIQWYSIHTGLPFKQHQVYRLTDGLRASHADIWHVLQESGMVVGNMSSMNTRPFDPRDGFYVPDPWCANATAFPDELNTFYRFVASQVQGHYGNGNARIREALAFVSFLAMHGLRLSTMVRLGTQLFNEMRTKGKLAWRRPSVLDWLQFDVFAHYYRKHRPQLATFFINSTAHYQHCYWRHSFPEQFGLLPKAEELAKFGGAILYGYQQMDDLLGQFFEFEKDGATLVFATALSQQAYTDADERGGQLYYRPRDLALFLSREGIKYDRIEPVMAQQFMVRFADDGAARTARDHLLGFRVEGTQVLQVTHDGPGSLCVGNWIHGPVADDAVITHVSSNHTYQYYELFYQMDAMKSGRHHPAGLFWVKTGKHYSSDESVSILDILPTLLDYLGVDKTVAEALPGRSLIDYLQHESTTHEIRALKPAKVA